MASAASTPDDKASRVLAEGRAIIAEAVAALSTAEAQAAEWSAAALEEQGQLRASLLVGTENVRPFKK